MGSSPRITRLIGYTAVGLAFFVGLPEIVRWANNGALAQSSSSSPPYAALPSSNRGIITYGQSGGNNTIYNGQRYFQIGPETVASIKEQIPAGSTIIIGITFDDPPPPGEKEKLAEMLRADGYQVSGYALLPAPYFRGLRFIRQKDGIYSITFGDIRVPTEK
jgi:hypothetical protein